MPRDLISCSAAVASIPLQIDPAFLSYRAQASSATDRLTNASIKLNAARASRPEDTEGAAAALLTHARAAQIAADQVVRALRARIGGQADV